MYYELDERTALDFVRRSPLMESVFGGNDDLQSADLAEGNVNLIFRVYRERAPGTSVLVKQALPHARRYPEVKMPLERSRLEYDLLQLEARYCPDLVPKVYLYDDVMHVSLMEDLNKHRIMRGGLMEQTRYPEVARHMGRFMARTLFYTSDLFLPSADKKALTARFMNPVMRAVQEELVFSQPFIEHPNNRWNALLDADVARVHADDTLRSEIFQLKAAYMTQAEALLHNDLHTGSIMLNATETKVIDPEFAFVGPMGHDIGSYLGNLVLSYAAQEFHAADAAERAAYRGWLRETIGATWQQFEDEFQRVWDSDGNDGWPSAAYRGHYMRRLLQDTAGFAAAEMMRRVIGLAHVPDIDTIPDQSVRAQAERLALNVAQAWLLERRGVERIDDLLDVLAASAHPRAV